MPESADWSGVQAPPEHQYPLAQSAAPVQLVLHWSVPQTYAPQPAGVAVVQAPEPLQTLAGVAVPFVQDPGVHVTDAPG
jgi:hypothetical protein